LRDGTALGRDESSFARPLARLQSRLELDPALQIRIDRLTRLIRTAATLDVRNRD
jgi:uncharacterized protein involved in exopolysaccharide biosynthesis